MHSLVALLLVALVACSASQENPPAREEASVPLGERFALPFSGSAAVEDLRISFSAVTADSRCPKRVVCVWAGDAAVVLEVRTGAETRTVELHTSAPQPSAAEAFGYRIELVALDPYPEEPSERKPETYVANLIVERTGGDDR
ncbi:MAG: hypothetical protein ACREQJ_18530 [Candidatus Binatia bacterium]